MKEHFLFPGQLAAFQAPTEISTLLGSCIAVVLWDENQKVGGMNHFLLPEPLNGETLTARYGKFAIPELIRQVQLAGGRPQSLQACVYGGANVVSAIVFASGSVGEKNLAFAQGMLSTLKIPIVHTDVGGEKARTIKFNTCTGQTLIQVS